jgi:hypothetical protein
VLHRLFIKSLLLFLNTHPSSNPATFTVAVSHMDLLLRISRIFFKAQPYSLKNMKMGRIPLDCRSAQLKNLCLTTHNTHNRQISMPSVGIKPKIPPSQRPQFHFLDRAATGLDKLMEIRVKILNLPYMLNSFKTIVCDTMP